MRAAAKPSTKDRDVEHVGSTASGTLFELSARERALAAWLVVGVGVVYLILQLALVPMHRRPSWDEAIYLSQVSPRAPALWFLPWRARGITLLIAPVLHLGGSLAAVRLFLVLAFSAGLVIAFWIWVSVLGLGAPLAMALFAGGWLALDSGSEIKPNFTASLLGIAAAGFVVRRLKGDGRGALIGAAASVALMAVFRPAEAVVLTAAVSLYILLFRRAEWRILVPLTLGLALGWLPWLIEMSIRFGGPLNALRLSSAAAQGGQAKVLHNVKGYLANTSGQRTGRPVLGVIWWSWIIVMWLTAVIRAKTRQERTAVGLCSFAVLAAIFEYFVWIGSHQARYLLPAYGIVAIPCAMGVVSLLRGRMPAKLVGTLSLVLVIPWAVWLGAVVRAVERPEQGHVPITVPLGERVSALTAGRPCTLASTVAAPVLAYTAGCVVPIVPARLGQLAQGSAPFTQGALPPGGPSASELKALTSGDGLVIIVAGGRVAPPLALLSPSATFTGENNTWHIYEFGA